MNNPLENQGVEEHRGCVKMVDCESRLRDLNPRPPLYESQLQFSCHPLTRQDTTSLHPTQTAYLQAFTGIFHEPY